VQPIATGLTNSFTSVSASETGMLVYQTGGGQTRQLTWLDRRGKVLGTAGSPGLYNRVALASDGRQVAVQVGNENQPSNLWSIEFARGSSTRFSFGSNTDVDPVWFPDGSRLVFSSNRGGHFDVYQKAASGGGSEDAIFQSSDNKFITDISRDGRWLMYTQNGRTTGNDLWVLPLTGDRKALSLCQYGIRGTAGTVLSGRTLGGLYLERVGPLRGLCPALSNHSQRRQMDDFVRRR